MSYKKTGLLVVTPLFLLLAGCPSNDEGDHEGGGDAGDTGAAGDASGADAGTSDHGGTGGGDDPIDAGDSTGSGSAGKDPTDPGMGGSGGSGDDTPPDQGEISPELAGLCDDLVQLQKDKVAELGCSGDDSAAQRRLCEVSGSCMAELQTHYDCRKAATTWSCDTGDGHPQTNASCEDTSMAYFTCLQTAVHEEDPFGCAALAVARNEAADALGCDADDMLEFTCSQLYLRDLCLPEWDAMVECLDAAEAADDLECGADNALAPKGETCAEELSAFEACLPS